MWISLQVPATHLNVTVDSLSHVQASPLQTIQSDLLFKRLRTAFCMSCVLGQQVVFEARRTPVVTRFTSTVNAQNFKRPFSLSISTHGGVFLHHFLISEATGQAVQPRVLLLNQSRAKVRKTQVCCRVNWPRCKWKVYIFPLPGKKPVLVGLSEKK